MGKKVIRKAIIPAAGYGLRLLPITKAVPKELLLVGGKPMIQYAWEEALACGLKELGIIIHPEKEGIKKFFLGDERLEKLLKKKGWEDLYFEMLALPRRAKITFIYQSERRGLGHALLSAQDFVAEEPFALLNPDNIYVGPKPCLSLLLEAWEELKTSIVLLGRIKREETDKVGIAEVEPRGGKRLYLIKDLEEKPGPQRAKSCFGVWGRAILEPEIMAYLGQTLPDRSGEIQLTDALRVWTKERLLYGFLCPFKRFDAGVWPGFFQANLTLIKKNSWSFKKFFK